MIDPPDLGDFPRQCFIFPHERLEVCKRPSGQLSVEIGRNRSRKLLVLREEGYSQLLTLLDAGLSLLDLRHGSRVCPMIVALLTERNNGPTKLFRVRRRECRFTHLALPGEGAQDVAAVSNEFMLAAR